MHGIQGVTEVSHLPASINAEKTWNYQKGKQALLRAHNLAFPNKDCTKGCLEEQIDSHCGKDTNPSRLLHQSESRQKVWEDREAYEAYLDLV